MKPGGNYQSKTIINELETSVQILNDNTHFTKKKLVFSPSKERTTKLI